MLKFAGIGGAGGAAAGVAVAVFVAAAGYFALRPTELAPPSAPQSALAPAPVVPQPQPGPLAPSARIAPVAAPAPAPLAVEEIAAVPNVTPTPVALPVRPSFDVVRIEPDGTALIAGKAEPQAEVFILMDGAQIASENADRQGGFVSLLSIEPSTVPRVLSLRAVSGGRELVSAQTVIVAPTADVLIASAPAAVVPGTAPGAIASETPVIAAPLVDTPVIEPLVDTPPTVAPTIAQAPVPTPEPEAQVVAQAPASQPEPEIVAQAPGFEVPNEVASVEDAEQAPEPEPDTLVEDVALTTPTPVVEDVAVAEPAPTVLPLEEVGAAETSPVEVAQAPDFVPTIPDTAPRLGDVAGSGDAPRAPAQVEDTVVALAPAAPEAPAPSTAIGERRDTPQGVATGVAAPDAPRLAGEINAPNAPQPTTTPAPQPKLAQAPRVIVADELGVRVIQDPGRGPSAMANVSIDTITYDDMGDVVLGGRGSAAAYVRVYLDNDPIRTTRIGEDGQWRADLPRIDTRVYTLRVDEIEENGDVISRTETPFQPAKPEEAIAAAAAPEASIQVVTVQPGFTLWRIARENYGEGQLYVRVFEANSDKIRDPDLIYPGQIFTVPE